MKAYLASLALGVLVGVVYALFQVRSPAPPVIALLGLLGILMGEQAPALVKQVLANRPMPTASIQGPALPCHPSREAPLAVSQASSPVP